MKAILQRYAAFSLFFMVALAYAALPAMITASTLWGVLADSTLIGVALAADKKNYRFDLSTEYGPTMMNTETDYFFSKRVEEISGGRIKVIVHAGAALGYRERDHLLIVEHGAVPIATSLSGTLAGYDPIFLLSALPFVAKDFNDAQRLLDIALPYYEETFTKHNQVLLYTGWVDPSGVWAKTPITKAADLKQLKIRTYDATGTRLFQKIGASPVAITWADTVPQLATGGISSVLTGADGGAQIRLWDYTKVFTQINYAMPLTFVLMNKNEFTKLPPDLREKMLEAGKEATKWRREQVSLRLQKIYQRLRDNGMEVIESPTDELHNAFRVAAGEIVEAWVESSGGRGQEILQKFGYYNQ